MKLLVDENLSPTLVQLLAAKGVPAAHVAHLGMAGATEPEVLGARVRERPGRRDRERG